MSGGELRNHPCVEDLRRWIDHVGTGCRFATHLVAKVLFHYELVPGPLTPDWVAEINAHIDAAAAEGKTVAIIFPAIHTPGEIAEALVVLRSGERWSIRWHASQTMGGRRFGLVRVGWMTPDRLETSVMGLSPLRCMPLTRRGPYSTIILWPGGRANPRAPKPAHDREPVGLIDAAHKLSDEEYTDRKRTTRADVEAMLTHEDEDRKLLRDVAFRLPLSVVERHLSVGQREV